MIVGVTGGIGSGKSTVLREVAKLGYPVYDCDAEAKRLIVENAEVRRQMIAVFGGQAYQDDAYNTQYVAQQVFANHSKLARLNAIVHPAVKQDVLRWAENKPVAFIETAILFQAGMADMCAGVAVVTVPEEERIARTLHRDRHANREDIERRIRTQQPPEEYLLTYSKPSVILENDDETPHRLLAEQLIQFAQSL